MGSSLLEAHASFVVVLAWWFWIGLALMLTAIAIYVLSDDLAFLPRPDVPIDRLVSSAAHSTVKHTHDLRY
jgi:hypothetical protein